MHASEETVARFHQTETLVAGGQSVANSVRALGVSEVTYNRWRAEYGGLKLDAVKRLNGLERENARLKRALVKLTLEKVILKGAGYYPAPPGSY